MIGASDRVRIWAAQLAANDFPPVCAMTGRPAETWRLFRFATLRGSLMRASGHLPLTRSAAMLVAAVEAASGLTALAVILTIAGYWISRAYGADPDLSAISRGFIIIGRITLLAGFAAFLVRRGWVGPVGDVEAAPPGYRDRVIEMRRLHPEFVAAVRQMQAARMAQSPGSN